MNSAAGLRTKLPPFAQTALDTTRGTSGKIDGRRAHASTPREQSVTIDTRRIPGRLKLHFDNLDEMLAYAERLIAAGTTQRGNWSLGQVLQHLALIQNASIDGFPKRMPRPVRTLLKLFFKGWMLRHGFPPSGPNVTTLTPEPIEATVALANLRAATDRVKRETRRSENPGFGAMPLDEWNLLYLRHAELHLSFCVPRGHAGAGSY